MKKIIALALMILSPMAFADKHDLQPNPRYDSDFKITTTGSPSIDWRTVSWNSKTSLNGWNTLAFNFRNGAQAPHCSAEFAVRYNAKQSANDRAIGTSGHRYDVKFDLDCDADHDAYRWIQIYVNSQFMGAWNNGDVLTAKTKGEVQAIWSVIRNNYMHWGNAEACNSILIYNSHNGTVARGVCGS